LHSWGTRGPSFTAQKPDPHRLDQGSGMQRHSWKLSTEDPTIAELRFKADGLRHRFQFGKKKPSWR